MDKVIKYSENLLIENKFSISLLLTDDKKINHLNKKFRQINSPTNVLSFPTMPTNFNTNNFLCSNYSSSNFLGDIVMSSNTLIKEAKKEKKILEDHFTHLFIHGILHLLGYDHEKSNDAKIMEALEIKILKSLYISNPYKELIK